MSKVDRVSRLEARVWILEEKIRKQKLKIKEFKHVARRGLRCQTHLAEAVHSPTYNVKDRICHFCGVWADKKCVVCMRPFCVKDVPDEDFPLFCPTCKNDNEEFKIDKKNE